MRVVSFFIIIGLLSCNFSHTAERLLDGLWEGDRGERDSYSYRLSQEIPEELMHYYTSASLPSCSSQSVSLGDGSTSLPLPLSVSSDSGQSVCLGDGSTSLPLPLSVSTDSRSRDRLPAEECDEEETDEEDDEELYKEEEDEESRYALHQARDVSRIVSSKSLLGPLDSDVLTSKDFSPLCQAAYVGDSIKVQNLLEAKADVLAADHALRTPLHWAVLLPCWKQEHTQSKMICIQALYEAKADINARDCANQTPLMCALAVGTQQCVQKLIALKAIIDIKQDQVAFSHIMKRSAPEFIPLLLEAKANVNISYDNHQTPLTEAILLSSPTMVNALLEAKADVTKEAIKTACRLRCPYHNQSPQCYSIEQCFEFLKTWYKGPPKFRVLINAVYDELSQEMGGTSKPGCFKQCRLM